MPLPYDQQTAQRLRDLGYLNDETVKRLGPPPAPAPEPVADPLTTQQVNDQIMGFSTPSASPGTMVMDAATLKAANDELMGKPLDGMTALPFTPPALEAPAMSAVEEAAPPPQLATPASPVMPTQPTQASSLSLMGGGMGMGGFNMQQAAAREMAGVEGAKGNEMSALYERLQKEDVARLEANRAAQAERETKVADQLSQLTKATDELNGATIDPKRFWAEASSSSKVLAGIGLFLGSFSPDGNNRAVNVIQGAIDRDIDAQKANLENKQKNLSAKRGIYADMVSTFRDKTMAEEATRLAYLKNAELTVQRMAAKYQGPEAKAKANLLIGQIQAEKDRAAAAFALQAQRAAAQPGYSP